MKMNGYFRRNRILVNRSIRFGSSFQSRGLSAEEEHTIIVNIEDHTGEPLLQGEPTCLMNLHTQ